MTGPAFMPLMWSVFIYYASLTRKSILDSECLELLDDGLSKVFTFAVGINVALIFGEGNDGVVPIARILPLPVEGVNQNPVVGDKLVVCHGVHVVVDGEASFIVS